MPDELINRGEVLRLLGLSEGSRRSYFDRMFRQGGFPAPVVRGGGRGAQSQWARSAVEAWIAARQQDRLVRGGIEYLSDVEICRQIDRSTWTLYKWMKKGKLPQPDIKLRQSGLKKFWAIAVLRECGLDVS